MNEGWVVDKYTNVGLDIETEMKIGRVYWIDSKKEALKKEIPLKPLGMILRKENNYLVFDDDIRAVVILFLICDVVYFHMDENIRNRRKIIINAVYWLHSIMDTEISLPQIAIITENKDISKVAESLNLEISYLAKLHSSTDCIQENVRTVFQKLSTGDDKKTNWRVHNDLPDPKRKENQFSYDETKVRSILANPHPEIPKFSAFLSKEVLEQIATYTQISGSDGKDFLTTIQIKEQTKFFNWEKMSGRNSHEFKIINSINMWKVHSQLHPNSKPCLIFLITNGVQESPSKSDTNIKLFKATTGKTDYENKTALEFAEIVYNHVKSVKLVIYDMNIPTTDYSNDNPIISKQSILSAFNVLRQVSLQNSRANIIALCQHDYFLSFQDDPTKKKELLSLLIDKFFKKLKNVIILFPMSDQPRPEILENVSKDRSNNFVFVSENPKLQPDIFTKDSISGLSLINVASCLSLVWSAFPRYTSNHVRGQFIDQFCNPSMSGNVMKLPHDILEQMNDSLKVVKKEIDYSTSEEKNIFVRIAIDDYESPSQRLNFPVQDATKLAATLHKYHGFSDDVRYQLLNKQSTLEGAKELLKKLQTEEKLNKVIFYFAGHGERDGLIMYSEKKVTFLYKDLSQLLSKIKCKNLLIILDCCHSGGADTNLQTHSHDTTGLVYNADTVEVIYSSTLSKTSTESSGSTTHVFGSGISFFLNLILSGKVFGKEMNHTAYHSLRFIRSFRMPILFDIIMILSYRYGSSQDDSYLQQIKIEGDTRGIEFMSQYKLCEDGGRCQRWKDEHHRNEAIHVPICPYVEAGYEQCPYVSLEKYDKKFEKLRKHHLEEFLHEPKQKAMIPPHLSVGKGLSFNFYQGKDCTGQQNNVEQILNDIKDDEYSFISISCPPNDKSAPTLLIHTLVEDQEVTKNFEDVLWFDCDNYDESDVIRQQRNFLRKYLNYPVHRITSALEGNEIIRNQLFEKFEFKNFLVVILNCTSKTHLEGFWFPKAKTILSTDRNSIPSLALESIISGTTQGSEQKKTKIAWYGMRNNSEEDDIKMKKVTFMKERSISSFWSRMCERTKNVKVDDEQKGKDENQKKLLALLKIPVKFIHRDIFCLLAEIVFEIPSLVKCFEDFDDIIPMDFHHQIHLQTLCSMIVSVLNLSEIDLKSEFEKIDKFLLTLCDQEILFLFSWETLKDRLVKGGIDIPNEIAMEENFREFFVNYVPSSSLWEHGPNKTKTENVHEILSWIKFSLLHVGNINSVKEKLETNNEVMGFIKEYNNELKRFPEALEVYWKKYLESKNTSRKQLSDRERRGAHGKQTTDVLPTWKMGNHKVEFLDDGEMLSLVVDEETIPIRKVDKKLEKNSPSILDHNDEICVFYDAPFLHAFSLEKSKTTFAKPLAFPLNTIICSLSIYKQFITVATKKDVQLYQVHETLNQVTLFLEKTWNMENTPPCLATYRESYLCIQFEDKSIQLLKMNSEKGLVPIITFLANQKFSKLQIDSIEGTTPENPNPTIVTIKGDDETKYDIEFYVEATPADSLKEKTKHQRSRIHFWSYFQSKEVHND